MKSAVSRCLRSALFAVFANLAFAQQVVSHVEPDTNTIIWRIDQPVVNQYDTPFPEIRFQPRDKVTVQAGGCVQTGGKGKTWKRYVDPDFYSGGDADRLYRGLITIPTIPPGPLSPVAAFVEKTVQVLDAGPSGDTSDWYLHLGYKDEDGAYGDNGYSSHDDGDDDQCKDVGDAWIVLTIAHSATLTIAKPAAPMDLWWNSVDDNALGLNPLWGSQVTSPGSRPDAAPLCNSFHDEGDVLNLGNPPCTTQHPTVDEPGGGQLGNYAVCQLDDIFNGSVHGHVNWGFATYTGTLFFEDWQVPGIDVNFGDNDYDFALVRNDQAGVTMGNHFQYHSVGNFGLGLEFDSIETVDNFVTPWWMNFRAAVQAHPPHTGDWTAAQALVDGREAIVIGLVGIDTQHGPHAEVHPVMALAIHVSTSPTEEVWAFFARNWGDEGFCSQDQHYFPGQKLEFFFPNPDDQTTLDIGPATTIMGTSGQMSWGTKIIPKGLVFSVKLLEPAQKGIIHGEIHLTRTSSVSQPAPAVITLVPAALRADPNAPEKEARESLEPLFEQLSPARQRLVVDAYRATRRPRTAPASRNLGRDDSIVEVKAHDLDPTNPKDDRQVAPGNHEFDTQLDAERQIQYAAFSSALGGSTQFHDFLNSVLLKGKAAPENASSEPARDSAAMPPAQPPLNRYRVRIERIDVPDHSLIGGDPWQFDLFLDGRRQAEIARRLYYMDSQFTFSPLAPLPALETQAPSLDKTVLETIGTNSRRAEGSALLHWDLNSRTPEPIALAIDLGNGESFALRLVGTNAPQERGTLKLDSITFQGTNRSAGTWQFRILVNDRTAFDVPAAEYKPGSPYRGPMPDGSFDAGASNDIPVKVIAYRGDVAQGRIELSSGTPPPAAFRALSAKGAEFLFYFGIDAHQTGQNKH